MGSLRGLNRAEKGRPLRQSEKKSKMTGEKERDRGKVKTEERARKRSRGLRGLAGRTLPRPGGLVSPMTEGQAE